MKKITQFILGAFVLLALGGAVSAIVISPDALAATRDTVQKGVTEVGGTGTGNESGDLAKTIRNVINILLFIIGLIAVLFIVIAGFRFVTSNGDAGTVSSAKNTIIYAILGIVIAVMAYAIVNFILTNIN